MVAVLFVLCQIFTTGLAQSEDSVQYEVESKSGGLLTNSIQHEIFSERSSSSEIPTSQHPSDVAQPHKQATPLPSQPESTPPPATLLTAAKFTFPPVAPPVKLLSPDPTPRLADILFPSEQPIPAQHIPIFSLPSVIRVPAVSIGQRSSVVPVVPVSSESDVNVAQPLSGNYPVVVQSDSQPPQDDPQSDSVYTSTGHYPVVVYSDSSSPLDAVVDSPLPVSTYTTTDQYPLMLVKSDSSPLLDAYVQSKQRIVYVYNP